MQSIKYAFNIHKTLCWAIYIYARLKTSYCNSNIYKTDQKKTHKILIIQSASCQPCKFMSKKGGVKFVYIFYSLTNFLYKKKTIQLFRGYPCRVASSLFMFYSFLLVYGVFITAEGLRWRQKKGCLKIKVWVKL